MKNKLRQNVQCCKFILIAPQSILFLKQTKKKLNEPIGNFVFFSHLIK